jgi:hypothetical protein
MSPALKLGGGSNPEIIGTITVNGTTYTKYRLITDEVTMPNATILDIPIGLSRSDVHGVTSLHGSYYSGNFAMPLPYYAQDIELQYRAAANNASVIRITTSSDRSTYKARITMEYY